jgi:hypothetical protein
VKSFCRRRDRGRAYQDDGGLQADQLMRDGGAALAARGACAAGQPRTAHRLSRGGRRKRTPGPPLPDAAQRSENGIGAFPGPGATYPPHLAKTHQRPSKSLPASIPRTGIRQISLAITGIFAQHTVSRKHVTGASQAPCVSQRSTPLARPQDKERGEMKQGTAARPAPQNKRASEAMPDERP